MGKRLSDTAALVNSPGPSGVRETESASTDIRKIDNGWLTRRTHYDGRRAISTETFTPDRPDVDLGQGLDPMKRAKDYMNKT